MGHTDEQPTDEGAGPGGAGLSWPRVIALLAAFCWLAGAVGWFVAQDRPPGPTSVDAGFYLDMIAHHEQAVEMALIELQNGSNSIVRSYAQETVIFQQYEIGRMDEQLRAWGISRTQRGDTAMGWMGMPVAAASMPGMATDAQITELQQAGGAAADGMFLELLAAHHRGGIHMASYAAAHAHDGAVRALAARMVENQGIEINEYRQVAERFHLAARIEPYVVG